MTLPAAPHLGMRITAAAMLTIEIAIHVDLAPDHLREVPYIGASFVTASMMLALVLAGTTLAPSSAAPWALGALLCTGMAITFVASRTVGLPGFHEAWTSDGGLGLLALPPEAIFIAIALKRVTYLVGRTYRHAYLGVPAGSVVDLRSRSG